MAVREATRLFAERGTGAVSVQDVADAVGTTKQAVLYHFGTKDALVDAVLSRLLERGNTRLVELMGALAAEPDVRMEQVLWHLQRMFEEEPHAAAVLLRFLLDGRAEAARRLEAGAQPWLRFTVDLLARGQREGWVRRGLDPEVAAAQMGMLLLTHFALLPVEAGPSRGAPADWRARLLGQLAFAIRAIVFEEPQVRDG